MVPLLIARSFTRLSGPLVIADLAATADTPTLGPSDARQLAAGLAGAEATGAAVLAALVAVILIKRHAVLFQVLGIVFLTVSFCCGLASSLSSCHLVVLLSSLLLT